MLRDGASKEQRSALGIRKGGGPKIGGGSKAPKTAVNLLFDCLI